MKNFENDFLFVLSVTILAILIAWTIFASNLLNEISNKLDSTNQMVVEMMENGGDSYKEGIYTKRS